MAFCSMLVFIMNTREAALFYINLAVEQEEKGKKLKALSAYSCALNHEPENKEALTRKFLLLCQLNRYTSALELATGSRSGEIGPDTLACARILGGRGFWEEALDACDFAQPFAAQEQKLELFCQKALILGALGLFKDSLALCERVLNEDPAHQRALSGKKAAISALRKAPACD